MTRFNISLSALAFAAVGLMAVGTVHARGADAEVCQGQKARKALTPAQKAERKAKFDAMTDEEKAAQKAKRKAKRKTKRKAKRAAKLENMTPEQRAAWEAKKAERKAKRAAAE